MVDPAPLTVAPLSSRISGVVVKALVRAATSPDATLALGRMWTWSLAKNTKSSNSNPV